MLTGRGKRAEVGFLYAIALGALGQRARMGFWVAPGAKKCQPTLKPSRDDFSLGVLLRHAKKAEVGLKLSAEACAEQVFASLLGHI